MPKNNNLYTILSLQVFQAIIRFGNNNKYLDLARELKKKL